MRRIGFVFAFLLCGGLLDAAPAPDLAPVKQWITRQSGLKTISADFIQTRALRTLRSPFSDAGHIWFSAPNEFRWDIGQPAHATALRRGNVIYLISPKEKKAKRYTEDALGKKSGMQNLAMIQFPVTFHFRDFQSKFDVTELTVAGTRCDLSLLPKDLSARKYLAKIRVSFDTETGDMLGFELAFKDGSSLRNEFSKIRVNDRIDPRVFDFDLSGYKIEND